MNSSEAEIKNVADLFKNLNISENSLSVDSKSFLHQNGYLIVPPTKFIKTNLKNLNKTVNNLKKSYNDKRIKKGKKNPSRNQKPVAIKVKKRMDMNKSPRSHPNEH